MSYFKAKMHQIQFGWGSAPDPAGWAYSTPPDPLDEFKEPTSKEMDGMAGRGREGRGREGREREGRAPPGSCLHPPSWREIVDKTLESTVILSPHAHGATWRLE